MADNVIEFLIKGDASSGEKAFGKLEGAIGGVTKVLGALGIAFGAMKFAKFVREQITVADQMGKMALKSAVAVESFSQLSAAFELSDLSAEETAASFRFLNKAIDEAKQGNEEAQISFASIGLSMRDLKRDSPDEVLLKIADAFTQIEDPVARNTMLLEKFGRAGLKLAPAMKDGREGIEALMKQADRLGLTVDKDFSAAAEKFNDSLTVISQSVRGATRQFAKDLLPILNETIDALFDFSDTGEESILPWGKITVGVIGAVAAVLLSLVTIVKGVTTAVSASFKATGEIIGASMASIEQAMHGDFKGAIGTLKEGWNDMGQTAQKAVSSVDDDLLKTGAAINKMVDHVLNYGESIKKAGEETEAASKKPGLNPISKEAAARLKTIRIAFNAFISEMASKEQTASGNRLALLDADYNNQVNRLADMQLSRKQYIEAMAALDKAYAAQREQLNDEMLSQLGIANESYRARTAQLIIEEGLLMEAAGISQIEADKFVKVSLLEQQMAYLEAKNAALGEDYLTQDEITLARFEAESLRLWTSLEQELITREQFNAAMLQAETEKQARLGDIQAQAEANRSRVSKMTYDQQLAYASTALDSLTALMQTQSKAGFRIGKAAAIAQAVINTYTGATGAYASASAIPVVGWILGPLAAAAAIVLGMQNVSKIRGQQMGQAHAGMTNVPNEGTFLLDKGERVIQPEQNKDLTNFLAGGGGGGQNFTIQNMEIHILENATSYEALLKMDERELRELVVSKFYKAFDTLDRQGIRPVFVERYAR